MGEPIKQPDSNSITPIKGPNSPAIQKNHGRAESGHDQEAQEVMGSYNLLNVNGPGDIDALFEKLGIKQYNTRQRIEYLKIHFKPSSLNPDRIVNFWGMIAHELNGMAIDEMARTLHYFSLEEIEEIQRSGDKFPGVGNQSNVHRVTKAILAYENGSFIPTENWRNVDHVAVINWNRYKFLKYKDLIISENAHQILFHGKGSYGGNARNDAAPSFIGQTPNGDDKSLEKLLWDEFISEGSCASVNIFDNAIFTWGRGFAGFQGGLFPVLKKLYADPAFKRIFNSVGISVGPDAMSIFVYEAYSISGNTSTPQIWAQIKKSEDLILFFIALGEMIFFPLKTYGFDSAYFKQKNSDVQFGEILNINGLINTVPRAQLDVWKRQLPNTVDYERFIKFIGHLFHWLPAYGKYNPSVPYSNSSYILRNKDGSFIKADMHILLAKFAEKASTDPYPISLTEISTNTPGQEKEVVIYNLTGTKFIEVSQFLLDDGHFLSFGGDIVGNRKVNCPGKTFFDSAPSNPLIIQFKKIELYDPQNPMRGYKITDLNNREIRLNTLKFNEAAIYYKFKGQAGKSKTLPLDVGYILLKKN